MQPAGTKKSASVVSIIILILILGAAALTAYLAYKDFTRKPSSPAQTGVPPQAVAPAQTSDELGPLVQGNLSATSGLNDDVYRKADIDTLAVSLQAWKDGNGKYPEKSACVESLITDNPGIEQYLRNGKLPSDPGGPRMIGKTSCRSGYYYQSLGNKGCILWAKVDSETGGNISSTPEETAEGINSGLLPEKTSSGAYYIADMTGPSAASALMTREELIKSANTFDTGVRTSYSVQIANPNIIDPNSFIFEIKPGGSGEDFIIINNTSNLPAEFILYGADAVIDPEGKVSYKTLMQEQDAVGKWISFDRDRITVGPGNKQQVGFRVTIPAGTPLSQYEGGVAAELAATVINPYTNEKIDTRYMMIVNFTVTDDPQPIVKKSITEKVKRTQ